MLFGFSFRRKKPQTKYVLCRPLGGLNDILCQIERCCRYGEQFNRVVLVDTNYRYSSHFKDRFSKYFVSLQENLIFADTLRGYFLDRLSAYPSALQGRTNSYQYYYDKETGQRNDRISKVRISFDFNAEYQEDLLIHTQSGGGDLSEACLSRMKLHDALADEFIDRLRAIGGPYSAIHVRNTDITTDYSDSLRELAALRVSPLFVATDDKSVLEHFRNELRSSRIFSFSDLHPEAGRPLHLNLTSEKEAHTRNKDAILDLLTLAQANKLIICKADKDGIPKSGYSGYSRLAQHLNSNRNLMKSLVCRNEIEHMWRAA